MEGVSGCLTFASRLTLSPHLGGEESPDNTGNHTFRKERRIQRNATESASEIQTADGSLGTGKGEKVG